MIEPIKKLYRSSDERILAGVAGGIGRYFNVDPLFIRLIFVLLALVQGLGILLYVIFIFIIPKEGGKYLDAELAGKKIKEFAQEAEEKTKQAAEEIEKQGRSWTRDRKRVIGLVILLVGLLALLNEVVSVRWFRWDIFWRVALIVVGFYLLVKTDKKQKSASSEKENTDN